MDKNVFAQKYALIYSGLNLKLFKDNENIYYFSLSRVLMNELLKGYRSLKILKPNKTGTKITFVSLKNKENVSLNNKEFENEIQKITDDLIKFNIKKGR